MKHLQQFLKIRVYKIPHRTTVVLFVTAIIGFVDSAYLTIEHYMNAIPPCAVGDCELVLTSAYASIGPFPVALLGAIFYFTICGLLFAYFDTKHHWPLNVALFATVIGFAAELWFVFLQLFVIQAICQYCMVSAVTAIVLFVVAMHALAKHSSSPTISEIL
jgi:uncharacterized membrane protein